MSTQNESVRVLGTGSRARLGLRTSTALAALLVAGSALAQPGVASDPAAIVTDRAQAAPEQVAQTVPPIPQETQDEMTEPMMEEMIVTARRVTENLQDVPVAITAFSENALKALQADNLSGLQGAVPNLNLVQGRGSSSSANVYIRGIGQPDALATFDPGVGIYISAMSSSPASRAPCSTSTTPSGSKCCAVPRARSMAATPSPALSSWCRAAPPTITSSAAR